MLKTEEKQVEMVCEMCGAKGDKIKNVKGIIYCTECGYVIEE